jgi:hypothetical protein
VSRRVELVDLDDLFASAPTTDAGNATAPTGGEGSARAVARWLLGRSFFSVALGTVIYGVLWVVRIGVPYSLIVGAIFVVTVLRRALRRADIRPLPGSVTGRGQRLRPDPWTGEPVDDRTPDGAQVAIGRWESRLSRRGASAQVTEQLRSRLYELVDERLRLRHGLTMTTDPNRARQLIGETLWTMIHQPPRHGFTPEDLSVLVDQMEAL